MKFIRRALAMKVKGISESEESCAIVNKVLVISTEGYLRRARILARERKKLRGLLLSCLPHEIPELEWLPHALQRR